MDAELKQIVGALKAHLSAYPNAADTVDGIQSWWLGGKRGGVRRAVLERALMLLVNEDFVVARRMANGIVIYALKK